MSFGGIALKKSRIIIIFFNKVSLTNAELTSGGIQQGGYGKSNDDLHSAKANGALNRPACVDDQVRGCNKKIKGVYHRSKVTGCHISRVAVYHIHR